MACKIKKTRKINKKVFTLQKGFSKKSDVEKYTTGLKKKGNLVRTIKGTKGCSKYLVFSRKK